uniref:Uncharacterized protein n=1 Tax=Anguilla anguilla TaxID=7936 RepID=A0A0E9TIN6_ANGAN
MLTMLGDTSWKSLPAIGKPRLK